MEEGGKSMFDGFVCIDGISGESSDDRHAGWIEIMDIFNHIIAQRGGPNGHTAHGQKG